MSATTAARSETGGLFGPGAAGTTDTVGTGWQVIDLGPHLRAAQGGLGLRQDRPIRAVARVEVSWGWVPAVPFDVVPAAVAPAATMPAAIVSVPSVPLAAFVQIGRRPNLFARLTRRAKVAKRPLASDTAPSAAQATAPATANDNLADEAPKRGRVRAAARDIFFLVLLVVTLVGAYQSGRLVGAPKIIVIPETALPKGRITLRSAPPAALGLLVPPVVAASTAIG